MKIPDSANPGKQAKLGTLSKSGLIALLESLPCAPSFKLEACAAERLALELSTHQVELEAQNQELRESRQLIEEARDRFSDLYDFAPTGYATLDKQGCIREINLTGAAMLGEERINILGKPLIIWLKADCHSVFHQHLKRVFASGERCVDELMQQDRNGLVRNISLTSIAIAHGSDACRTALVDITPLKEKEAELTRSRQRLRDLSAHLEKVREDERHHMAREIHDELGQKLTALRFEVAMLDLAQEPFALSQTTASILKQVDETIASVRAIASDLRPAVLDLGLVAAIEWQLQQFRQRTGIPCVLKVSDEEISLDNARATAVFRIVQESLTNILRHAEAGKVLLTLRKNRENLHVQIEDNGCGLPADALTKASSFGLVGMRERVLLLGGELDISSKPGRGTKLKLAIPLEGKA